MNNFVSLLSVSAHEGSSTLLIGAIYYFIMNTKTLEATKTYRVHIPRDKRDAPGPHKLKIVETSYKELLGMTKNGKGGSLKILSTVNVNIKGPLTRDNLEDAFNTPTPALYNTVATSLGGLKLGIFFGMDEHPWWMRIGVPVAINMAQHVLKLPMTSGIQHGTRVEFFDQELPTTWPDDCYNVILDDGKHTLSIDDVGKKPEQ